MVHTTVIADGLYFGEGPRWHNGRLWFSDFYDHAVKSMDAAGQVTIEHRLDDQPSGLGWLPDGRLLVVSMRALKVLRQEGDGFVVHADLSGLARHLCNDMVVDGAGRAWVGNFGFDLDTEMERRGPESLIADHPVTNLARIDPDGSVHLASPGMHFPNGSVVTPDGKTLVVAETLALCLTAFDIGADGELANRRTWAEVGMRAPDGICLNADGNIWVANALAPECVLFAPGGEVLQVVETSQNCFACMLGGADGRDLFLVTAQASDHATAAADRTGKIETVRVDSPGAGWP
ncbi:MAG: SMP-30/gluconolactonase/LRE family protein [Gammaproteobacteria bacterium]|jgi:sugar lactone lactonase YvrE|nr:SMP-30/gluconolactonase/LRE family protein [Gammaproteobacteria bacterium]